MPSIHIDRLAVISIQTTDLPATVHFYRDVLGLSGLAHHGHRPAFDLGHGLYFVILEVQGAPPQSLASPRFPVLAFAVPELDGAIEQLKHHRVEMPWGVESDGNNRWVQFYDPGGNLIELAQFALW